MEYPSVSAQEAGLGLRSGLGSLTIDKDSVVTLGQQRLREVGAYFVVNYFLTQVDITLPLRNACFKKCG